MIQEDSCLEFEIKNSLNTLPESIKEHIDIVLNMAVYFGKHVKFLNREKLNYLFFLTDAAQYTRISEAFILSDLVYLATDKGPVAYSPITGREIFDEINSLFIEDEAVTGCIIESDLCKTHPCSGGDGVCPARKEKFLFLKPNIKFDSGNFTPINIRVMSNVCDIYKHLDSATILEYLCCPEHAWYPTWQKEANSRINFKYYEQFMSESQIKDRDYIRESVEKSKKAFSSLFSELVSLTEKLVQSIQTFFGKQNPPDAEIEAAFANGLGEYATYGFEEEIENE